MDFFGEGFEQECLLITSIVKNKIIVTETFSLRVWGKSGAEGDGSIPRLSFLCLHPTTEKTSLAAQAITVIVIVIMKIKMRHY